MDPQILFHWWFCRILQYFQGLVKLSMVYLIQMRKRSSDSSFGPCFVRPVMLTVCSFVLFSGDSGLGKSTLINSLFLTDLYPERYIPGAAGNTNMHKVIITASVA